MSEAPIESVDVASGELGVEAKEEDGRDLALDKLVAPASGLLFSLVPPVEA